MRNAGEVREGETERGQYVRGIAIRVTLHDEASVPPVIDHEGRDTVIMGGTTRRHSTRESAYVIEPRDKLVEVHAAPPLNQSNDAGHSLNGSLAGPLRRRCLVSARIRAGTERRNGLRTRRAP